MAWAHMMTEDEASKGRVVWSMGGASVVLSRSAETTKTKRRPMLGQKPKRNPHQVTKGAKEGVWSATDETPQENKGVAGGAVHSMDK